MQRKYQHTEAISDNRASQLCACLGSCGKYIWDPGPMNATISREKVMRMSWVLWKVHLGPRSHECDNKQGKSFGKYVH